MLEMGIHRWRYDHCAEACSENPGEIRGVDPVSSANQNPGLIVANEVANKCRRTVPRCYTRHCARAVQPPEIMKVRIWAGVVDVPAFLGSITASNPNFDTNDLG